jgi:hypothetical protein
MNAQESDSVGYVEEIGTSDYGEEEDTYQEDESSQEGEGHELVTPESLTTTRDYQSEDLKLKKFDENKWKKIAGETDYSEKPPEKPKKNQEERGLPSLPPWSGPVLRILAYAVIAGVVIFLLYLVVKNISLDVKLRKTKVTSEGFEVPVENIEDIDIELLLQQALSEGNFRMAVRLYYLRLLKKLNETGMITWKKDKTNRDYLTELFQREYHFDEIKKLTLSYEQVWYGEHGLTPDSFQRITSGFESVYQKIQTPSVQ